MRIAHNELESELALSHLLAVFKEKEEEMKFKIGDRIIVYSTFGFVKGSITFIDENNMIEINGCSDSFHPKQCRRLVKKEHLHVWIKKEDAGFLRNHRDRGSQTNLLVYREAIVATMVELVEVRKKK